MNIRFCPKCKNTDIMMVAGGVAGLWRCKKCGFTSAIFPEQELNEPEKKIKKLK